jgi:proteasome lid subunit RPN8/RPN11
MMNPETKQLSKRQPDAKRSNERQPAIREFVETPDPVLRFSPTAWAKLLYFRDRGESEIGGFGIATADDLLRIEEFSTVKQEVTFASIAFDDLAVADFFESQVDAGRKPEQFGRIWLHTHPGNSAQPSGTDEETFQRVFGRCQWAVMFILARTGQCYARLRFNIGPGGEQNIPVEVDYSQPFGPSDFEAWDAEYRANVKPAISMARFSREKPFLDEELWSGQTLADEWLEDLEFMEPAERQLFLDQLYEREPNNQPESEANHERKCVPQSV